MARKKTRKDPVAKSEGQPGLKKSASTKRQKLPLTIGRSELLIDGSDRAFRKLVHGLFTFLALHEAIRDSYAAHVGLGGIQYTILQSIRHLSQRQDVNVRGVAEHLRLSGSFITAETTKLQEMGLLEKRQSLDDRRRVSLRATRKGMQIFDDLAPMQRTVNDVQFGGLSKEQFHQLSTIVDHMIGTSQEALTLLHYLKGSDPNYRMARIAGLPRIETIIRARKKVK